MKALTISRIALIALLAFTTVPLQADHKEGREGRRNKNVSQVEDTSGAGFSDMERAHEMFGQPVQFTEGGRPGRFVDLIVDLESGRALYAIVAPNEGGNAAKDDDDEDITRQQRKNQRIAARSGFAIPVTAFADTRGDALKVNISRQDFMDAPQVSNFTIAEHGSIRFLNNVYKHYNESTWWGSGAFGNIVSLQRLKNYQVQNVQGTVIGTIEDAVVDLPEGRVLYLALHPESSFNVDKDFIAVPPMAFTKASGDNRMLTLSADKEKLSSAPGFDKAEWPNLSNYRFASKVYSHFGKQPYFSAETETPTGREKARERRRNNKD